MGWGISFYIKIPPEFPNFYQNSKGPEPRMKVFNWTLFWLKMDNRWNRAGKQKIIHVIKHAGQIFANIRHCSHSLTNIKEMKLNTFITLTFPAKSQAQKNFSFARYILLFAEKL